jgi:protein tyrosine/serine phosphatase
MSRWLQNVIGIGVVVVLVAVPVAYGLHVQAEFRKFRVVREGKLYRSGQLSLPALKRLIHDYGIRTVISLRETEAPGKLPHEAKEEAYCEAQEINYYRIPPRNWSAPSGPPPVEKGVRKFLAVMSDPDNYPVLIHCFAGIHRSGAYCALYRMEFEHWSNADAIAELKAGGYDNLPDELDILGYLEDFRPSWRQDTKPEPAPKVEGKKKKHAAKKWATE